MKKFDIFDKPMNGLFNRTTKGGILSCIGLLSGIIMMIVSLNIYTTSSRGYEIDLQHTLNLSIPLSIDVEVLDRKCDELSFHWDANKSMPPTQTDITSHTSPEGCRFIGTAQLLGGEGDFHITLDDRQYTQQGVHKHILSLNSLSGSFSHIIREFCFGNSSDFTLQPLRNVKDDTSQSHYTYFLKVYSIDGGESYGYSVSKYSRQNLVNTPDRRALPGIYFRYSFEPEMLLSKTVSWTLKDKVLLCVSMFGSVITLLQFFSTCCSHQKSVNKR
ncbi:hypothetical protein WA171_005538, partial [Blastocystis sp. BT1]